MMEVPAFGPHWRIEWPGDGTALLRSEVTTRVLPATPFALVARLIDGSRSAAAIADLLEPEMAPEQVFYVLLEMERLGYIQDARLTSGVPHAAYWESLGTTGGEALRRLASCPAGAHFLDIGWEAAWRDAASAAGLHIAEGQPEFTVVIAADYGDEQLEAWNRNATATGAAWMLVKPGGRIPWLGPVFRPGGSACWACLYHRLRENWWCYPRGPRDGGLPAAGVAALHLAAVEAARFLASGRSSLEGAILTFDSGRLSFQRHAVHRRPQCKVCGQPAARAPRPITLTQRLAGSLGTGRRSCPPGETLRRLEPLVSPITGIVSRLHVETKNGSPFHLCSAAFSSAAAWRQQMSPRLRLSHSGGKGASEVEAKVSCLAEAVERYSVLHHGDEPFVRGSWSGFPHAAVHPAALLQYSADQYAVREHWNRSHGPVNQVPLPFDETAEISWTAAWSLSEQRRVYLPSTFVHLNHRDGLGFCRSDSNGCAAGNNIEEAILQGFLELVERDAAAIWWYNRIRRPAVELPRGEDQWLDAACRDLESRARHWALLDITTDLGIPCFAALCWNAPEQPVTLGLGAHLNPLVACRRAIVELVQVLQSGVSRSNPDAISWSRYATPAYLPHLEGGGRLALTSYADLSGPDLAADLQCCLAIARRHGLEVLTVDLTRPDIGFPVVRVVVPGLRHFWARFAPGRLFDVPVTLGWLSRSRSEPELNPILLFQ